MANNSSPSHEFVAIGKPWRRYHLSVADQLGLQEVAWTAKAVEPLAALASRVLHRNLKYGILASLALLAMAVSELAVLDQITSTKPIGVWMTAFLAALGFVIWAGGRSFASSVERPAFVLLAAVRKARDTETPDWLLDAQIVIAASSFYTGHRTMRPRRGTREFREKQRLEAARGAAAIAHYRHLVGNPGNRRLMIDDLSRALLRELNDDWKSVSTLQPGASSWQPTFLTRATARLRGLVQEDVIKLTVAITVSVGAVVTAAISVVRMMIG